MGEEYKGTKFKTIFIGNYVIEDSEINKLQRWGRIFSKERMAPLQGKSSAGNLSFRLKEGFVITSTGSNLGNLHETDFVYVEECNILKKEISVYGIKEPSSESMLHYQIYKRRADVKAVMHGHCDLIVDSCERLGIPCTEHERPYGTLSLVAEAMKALGRNNFIVMKNHGFISLGKTIDEAGKRAVGFRKMAVGFRKRRERI